MELKPAVAEPIVKVVDSPFGKRPFRAHIDPTLDGAEVVNAVSDRVRAELLRRIGLEDLPVPRDLAVAKRVLVAWAAAARAECGDPIGAISVNLSTE